MKLGVGICNFNRREDVCRAVASVADQGNHLEALLVVDNASSDGSVEALRSLGIKGLEVSVAHGNEGSAGGFSRVSRLLVEKGCDLLVLMDSDCWLEHGALPGLVDAMKAQPEVGVMGARIMHAHQPERIQECGAFLDWDEAEFRLNRRDSLWEGVGSLPELESVDYVPACALIARREVFEKVGHFYPGWFIYFDDIEWCWRARLAGFQVRVNNRVAAFHKGGGKVKTSHFNTYYFWRNRMRFFGIYAGEHDFPKMKGTLIETSCRAIATCGVLGLERAGQVIARAVRDAIGGGLGQAFFADGELNLDCGSEYQLPVQSRVGTCFPVDFLFDPLAEASASMGPGYVLDRFGKCISLDNHRRLQPQFIEKYRSLRLELGPRMDEYLSSFRKVP